MEPVIEVKNIGKQYRIGKANKAAETLGEYLLDLIRSPWRNYQNIRNLTNFEYDEESTFMALTDITFNVNQGEVIGIIGHNGAGKSTLLKILSRITEPSTGCITIRGRVSSLLEVGTGFHPDLSGRENIYMNGTLLGMKKKEIDRKLEAIIDFSGISKYIDTPVKRYSSGMTVRLAFSVAAHLEPEIMIIDEVLAVGDAEFQKKCLGKMQELGGKGRTVLFVSHNMAAVARICQKSILLKNGNLNFYGTTRDAIALYYDSNTQSNVRILTPPKDADAHKAYLLEVKVHQEERLDENVFEIDAETYVSVTYLNKTDSEKIVAVVQLLSEIGEILFSCNDFTNVAWWNTARNVGAVTSTLAIPPNFLTEGRYYLNAALCLYNPNETVDFKENVGSFTIVDNTTGNGARGTYVGSYWPGVIRPKLNWAIKVKSNNSKY